MPVRPEKLEGEWSLLIASPWLPCLWMQTCWQIFVIRMRCCSCWCTLMWFSRGRDCRNVNMRVARKYRRRRARDNTKMEVVTQSKSALISRQFQPWDYRQRCVAAAAFLWRTSIKKQFVGLNDGPRRYAVARVQSTSCSLLMQSSIFFRNC